jgi:hypothetical protein
VTFVPPNYQHIPLHRIWLIASQQYKPLTIELQHLDECATCQVALRVCLNSKTFGAVLKTLNDESGDPQAKAS